MREFPTSKIFADDLSSDGHVTKTASKISEQNEVGAVPSDLYIPVQKG
jgi:hypothetical protein